MKRFAQLVFITLVLVGVQRGVALAQQNQRSLLTVEPAQLDLEINNDSLETSSIVVVTNQYTYPVRMQAKFQAIDETTGRIIPAGDLDASLEDSLRLSETEFEVAPESRYFLTVTLSDTSNLQPGGHYAALVLEDVSSSATEGTVRSQVSIGTFIIKKQGEVRKILAVEKNIERSFLNFPSTIKLELLNDGNVHIVPRGYIRIFDDDFVYYESVFNASSATILPNQRFVDERKLAVAAEGWLPRKINIELSYRADGIESPEQYVEDFWYVPKYFLPVPVALLAFLVIIFLSRGRIKNAKESRN